MNNIDHFTIEHDGYTITFVRIAQYVGWHGTHKIGEPERGDWVTIADDSKDKPEAYRDLCHILAAQAAASLVPLRRTDLDKHSTERFLGEVDLTAALKKVIDQKTWK